MIVNVITQPISLVSVHNHLPFYKVTFIRINAPAYLRNFEYLRNLMCDTRLKSYMNIPIIKLFVYQSSITLGLPASCQGRMQSYSNSPCVKWLDCAVNRLKP